MSARDIPRVAHQRFAAPDAFRRHLGNDAVAHLGRSANEKENGVTRLLLAAPAGGHDDDDNLFHISPRCSTCPRSHRSTPRTRPSTTYFCSRQKGPRCRLSIGRTTIYAAHGKG